MAWSSTSLSAEVGSLCSPRGTDAASSFFRHGGSGGGGVWSPRMTMDPRVDPEGSQVERLLKEPPVAAFLAELRQRRIESGTELSRKCALTLRLVVSKSRALSTAELLRIVEAVGKRLIAANHVQILLSTILQRFLGIIRSEHLLLVQKPHYVEQFAKYLRDIEASESIATAPPSRAPSGILRASSAAHQHQIHQPPYLETSSSTEGASFVSQASGGDANARPRTVSDSVNNGPIAVAAEVLSTVDGDRQIGGATSGSKKLHTDPGGPAMRSGGEAHDELLRAGSRRPAGGGGAGEAGSVTGEVGGRAARCGEVDSRDAAPRALKADAAEESDRRAVNQEGECLVLKDGPTRAEATERRRPMLNPRIWSFKTEHFFEELKNACFESFEDLIRELKEDWLPPGTSIRDLFAHAGRILVYGHSSSVQRILKALRQSHLKKRRDLEVVCVGGDANDEGLKMAQYLSDEGFIVSYIELAAARSFASTCDAGLIGAVAILSTGAAVTISGGGVVAEAMRAAAKPLYVAAAKSKISTLATFQPFEMNEMHPFDHMSQHSPERMEGVSVGVVQFDCIAAQLITSCVTNMGDIHPAVAFDCVEDLFFEEDRHCGEECVNY